ncbi:hypothetical protein JTE90_005917 [Oedothorax gibbosus]|uniref:Uncharacterized protein n=1 Tax=Oedothorax gibbosus TaxID=931172 RepID=A0AAV6UB96_9ARAC|nr:hypothetical protein JTE90_005917 [Oedothorax gibbosus]
MPGLYEWSAYFNKVLLQILQLTYPQDTTGYRGVSNSRISLVSCSSLSIVRRSGQRVSSPHTRFCRGASGGEGCA